MTAAAYTGWAMLELMGHRQRVGIVSEVEAYGGKLLRIDIPAIDGGEGLTEFYGAASVYALRPLSEDLGRDWLQRHGDPRPVKPLGYRIEDRSAARADDDELGDDSHPDGA